MKTLQFMRFMATGKIAPLNKFFLNSKGECKESGWELVDVDAKTKEVVSDTEFEEVAVKPVAAAIVVPVEPKAAAPKKKAPPKKKAAKAEPASNVVDISALDAD